MITIKKAKIEDLDQLIPLFDAYRMFYRKESDKASATNFLRERISQSESIIYLALEGDQAIGFTQLYPLFSSTRMKRLWLLNDLFVAEKQRGKGVSKRLIDAAKDLAKATGAAGVSLETEQSNVIGNRLYPAVGFEVDKEHNFYFWANK